MNIEQAKKLSLPDIMTRLGYQPTTVKKDGQEYWYGSPFREEEEASFHTSFLGGKWIWNDFGDTGGTVIDFIMRHENITSVRGALSFLERMFQGHLVEKPQKGREGATEFNLFSFQQHREAVEISSDNSIQTGDLEFIKAHPIHNPIIHTYLKGRGIPPKLADRYLLEISYRNTKTGKSFFAFGMENRSGGYEIRAASDAYSFKSALKARDITLILGMSSARKVVNVFEGMTDFLSLLMMLNTLNLSGDTIIMHSLSSFRRTVDHINTQDYATINTFLDNNPAGKKHTARFQEECGAGNLCSQSSLFAPHTDLNDALRANQIPDFLAS